MKTIRHSFECNSSSSHSLSLNKKVFVRDTSLDSEEELTLFGGEFGWEWVKYNDALTKANYFAVYHQNDESMVDLLKEVIIENTDIKEIILSFSSEWSSNNWSYIDHQSQKGDGNTLAEIQTKDDIYNFIFNTKTTLITGNDNSCAPYGFWGDIRKAKANYILKIGNKTYYPETINTENYQEYSFHDCFCEYLQHEDFDYDYEFVDLYGFVYEEQKSGIFNIQKKEFDRTKMQYNPIGAKIPVKWEIKKIE